MILAGPFDPGAELGRFIARVGGAGAVASFVGLVRGESERVTALELDHHPRLTQSVVGAIGADARARFGLVDFVILHRHGRLAPGDPIVFVAAAAPHRRAAFEAVDYMMDRLKTEAPFWKSEHGPGGKTWIEARPSDIADRRRWDVGRG